MPCREAALAQAARSARGALRVRPVALRTAGLLMTDVPGQEDKLTAKGRRAIEARLAALGMTLAARSTRSRMTIAADGGGAGARCRATCS